MGNRAKPGQLQHFSPLGVSNKLLKGPNSCLTAAKTADTYHTHGHAARRSFTCLVKTLPLDASFGTTGVNNSVSTSCLLKTAGGEWWLQSTKLRNS